MAERQEIKSLFNLQLVIFLEMKWGNPIDAKFRGWKILYECSKLSVHGTEYQHGQFVVLPESSNTLPVFGKILKLLSCEQFGYFVIQNTSNKYCSKTDLYFVIENQQFTVVPCLQLPSYLPIEAYPHGAAKNMSLSLRNYILEHRN